MGNNFICPRCGNSNPRYIGYLNGEPYCRFCISMNGKSADKEIRERAPTTIRLGYNLSKEQNALSTQLLTNYKNKIDSLVNAVCGAGKTELVYRVIAFCLAQGKKHWFDIPLLIQRLLILSLMRLLTLQIMHSMDVAI